MILTLAAAAHAFTFEEVARWAAPADPRGLLSVSRAEGPRVVVLGEAMLQVFDRDTGVVVAEVAQGGAAVITRDPDGDGVSDLWVCGEQGVWSVPWGPDMLGPRTQVTTALCDAIIEEPGGIVTVNSSVSGWLDDGAGGVTGPSDLGFAALVGQPLLAWDGVDLAITEVGAGTIQVRSSLGVSLLDPGGTIGGLGLKDSALAWTLSEGWLGWRNGLGIALASGAGAFVVADLDADGIEDVVVTHAAGLGLVRGGVESLTALGGGAASLTAGDLDGDGCDEIAWIDVDSEQIVVGSVTDCGSALDRDGDGYSPDTGDCDDRDADRNPGQSEICNSIDDDCDGIVDEEGTTIAISGPMGINEGDDFEISWTSDGCPAAVLWQISAEGVLRCEEHSSWLECSSEDDANAMFTVAMLDAAGGIQVTDQHGLTIYNVSPELIIPQSEGCGSSGYDDSGADIYVNPGEYYELQLEAEDPGDDTVTFSGTDMPAGMTLSSDGFATFDVSKIGTYTPTLVLRDEDAGYSDWRVTVSVANEVEYDPCCGSSSAGIVGLVFLSVWRRRNSVPSRGPLPFHGGVCAKRMAPRQP